MPKKICEVCTTQPAQLKRPKNGQLLCASCFFTLFETEVHQTILKEKLFQAGDRVALGASGGKDSTVLMHLMSTLNQQYQYGIQLILVSIDEGIVGYRDDSLKTVHRNSDFYHLPLHILSYKELYGWTMDEIVKAIGDKSNCTFCGVFRRQALDRGAKLVNANKLVTGHNCDDTAETILMNVLRSDIPRLARCANTMTNDSANLDPEGAGEQIPRVKPMKYAYEKEIVLYAHFKKLDYFTTECTYSKEAFRGNARTLLKELERVQPSCVADIVHSGENLPLDTPSAAPANKQMKCGQCGYITSQKMCRACVLLASLNQGNPKIALRSTVSSGCEGGVEITEIGKSETIGMGGEASATTTSSTSQPQTELKIRAVAAQLTVNAGHTKSDEPPLDSREEAYCSSPPPSAY